MHPQPPTSNWGYRDHKSFVEVTNPDKSRHQATFGSHDLFSPPPPPIVLRPDLGEYNLWRKTSLICEARSLSHLRHLPKLLLIKEEPSFEVKYIGGLNVLLDFGCSNSARQFMENEDRWKDNLKWVRWRDKSDLSMDRVAWIRIVGLPHNLWGRRISLKLLVDMVRSLKLLVDMVMTLFFG